MSTCAAVIQLGWSKRCYEADDPIGIMKKKSKMFRISAAF